MFKSSSKPNNTIMDSHLIVNRSCFFIFAMSFRTGKGEIRHCTAEKSLVHGHLGPIFFSPLLLPFIIFPFIRYEPKALSHSTLDGYMSLVIFEICDI